MGRTQFSVILMILCAIKCLAVSYDELEDFAEYLQRTSQLSPILKKGVEYDDDDAEDKDDDDAWEESGKFEGDLILNERQRRLIVENVAEGLSRNGIRDGTKRWPNNEVIYFIQVEHFQHDQVQSIHNAIEELQQASCIKFRPYRKGDPDAVVIQGSRKGCFSQVGYQGGYQVLNLSGRHPNGRGCFRHGTIVHELLHTLGFYHMHSSPVRDDYVDIVWDNIVQAARHNFRKYNSFSVSNFGVTYDYDSVLHYSKHAFSANGQDTIVPKKKGAVIGQRIGLSEKDTLKLNKMYCDADSDEQQEENNNNKKKVIKKKPKQIQGIGYHQGKAVVFKVPTAMPYKLNDKPSPYAFNHFSKAPQILPSSENEEYRPNKDLMYSYKPSEQSDEYQEPAYYNNEVEKLNQGSEPRPANQQQNHNSIENSDQGNKNKGIEKPYYENAQVATLHNSDDKIQEPFFIEAIDRLSKIIQAHVYPSQTPDLSIYKMNKMQNYPEDNRGNEKEFKKDHAEFVIISPIKEALKPIKIQTLQSEKMDSAISFINKIYNSNKYPTYEEVYDRYHPPAKDDYYEDYRQIQTNEGQRPQRVQDTNYVDPSYPISYSEDYDDYSTYSPMRYKVDGDDDDDYQNYASEKFEGKKPSRSLDDCSRNIYAKNGNGAGPDYYSQRSSNGQDRISAPFRYLYVHDSYPSNIFKDLRDQKYYS